MATSTIPIGHIQTTLPKQLHFGSAFSQSPKGTSLETFHEDASHSQHFYFCTHRENEKDGVLATYDLRYIIEKSPTTKGFQYQESPRPHFAGGAEYPSWVKEDMMFILEVTGSGESTYIFRRKSDPNMVLTCLQDEFRAPIIIEEYQCPCDARTQWFTLQNPLPS